MTAGPVDLHWVQRPGTRIARVVRPGTWHDAVEILAGDPTLRPVAGGTDLVLELARSGQADQAGLLDLTAVHGSHAVEATDESVISIGAGVTHAGVLGSQELIDQAFPLAQACLEIGSPQLRNRATVVGNLVTASPANDTISALLALFASVRTIRSDDGQLIEREIDLVDFFTGFRATALEPGELITAVLIPQPPSGRRGIWVKAGLRKAQAISVVHAGLVLDFGTDGAVTGARIALGSVGPTVELNPAAAQAIVGSPLTETTIAAAAQAARDSVAPIDDGRATADYRSDTIVTVVTRALTSLANSQERVRWPAKVPLLAAEPTQRGPVPQSVVERETEITVTVNGLERNEHASTGTLLDWLRESGLPGTKEGCAEGECGACTVQVDGAAVMSCLVPAAQADGSQVVTIEGLGTEAAPHPMQQAFIDKFAVQCGYCIPGFVMAATTLADELDAVPTRDALELALAGNLCRCTGYYNIIDAVLTAMSAQEPS